MNSIIPVKAGNGCRIIMENPYLIVTLESKKEDMTIEEVIEELIAPALIGLGYSSTTIEERLGIK